MNPLTITDTKMPPELPPEFLLFFLRFGWYGASGFVGLLTEHPLSVTLIGVIVGEVIQWGMKRWYWPYLHAKELADAEAFGYQRRVNEETLAAGLLEGEQQILNDDES